MNNDISEIANDLPVRFPHWKFDTEYEECTLPAASDNIPDHPPLAEPIIVWCIVI